MAEKGKRNRPEHWVDADYPFPTEKNEYGETVYYVPVEVDSEEALVTLNAEENGGRCRIHFGPYDLNVVFMKTTDSDFAYDQKKWLYRQHMRNKAWNNHMVSLDGVINPDTDEEICLSENPVLEMMDDPFAEFEVKDLVVQIAEYIDARRPRNAKYRIIFELLAAGFGLSEIACKMKMTPASVSDYRSRIRVYVAEYLKKSVQDE